MHLISDDESFATCDTLLLSNFMNVRHLEFLLSSRLPHKYEKIILRDALTQWESEPFPANTRNMPLIVFVSSGGSWWCPEPTFSLSGILYSSGFDVCFAFCGEGLVYWMYFKKKIRLVLDASAPLRSMLHY
jgi:hypothetical protein